MPKSVAFLFPHPAIGPTGGYKVVYEYANRFAADGWQVHIVYSGSIYWKRKSLWHKLTNIVRQIQSHLKGYSSRGWFPLDNRVKEHLTLSLNYRHVPKADVYVATSPYTAYYLNDYPVDSKHKFYLIQGKEDWGPGLKAILVDTYHYPMQKITISNWLHDMLLKDHHENSIIIPNGFDFKKFSLTVPIQKKDPYRISMLYHEMARKDCDMGFRALDIVKKRFPQLIVSLFGVQQRPATLPDWYEYHQQPSAEEHNRLNNEAAIYIGTSRQEGWGLTVGEAMICGQAVACTDNPGYQEMAEDGVTALCSPIGDAEALASNVMRLIEDSALRISMANQGHDFIQRFTWDSSYSKLKALIEHEKPCC